MIFQNICILSLLIFCFVESNLSTSKKLNSSFLISGGLPKDEHNLGKFVASIRYRSYKKPSYGYQHFCGGAIISPRKILTAAHCLFNERRNNLRPFELVVVVGSTNRLTTSKFSREMNVARVKGHHNYGRDRTQFGDVGFLILEDEIQFDNPHVGIINLTSSKPEPKTKCTIMGWGSLFQDGPLTDRILFTDIEIYENVFCKRQYDGYFTDGMFCAGHREKWDRDSCEGDSGGPLICDDVLFGIVSWGYACGDREYPGVYTDVFYFSEWIARGPSMEANYILIIFLTLIV